MAIVEEIIQRPEIGFTQGSFPSYLYFDCYNNYAYNNEIARKHMLTRIEMWHKKTYIPPTECDLDQPTSTDGIDSSHQEFSVFGVFGICG